VKSDARVRRSIVARILAWPIDHPRVVLVTAAVIAVVSIMAVRRLRSSGSLDAMIAENNPAAVALGRLLDQFGSFDDLILVTTDPDASRSESESQQLLLDFADRMQSAINADPAAKERVTHVRLGMNDSAPARRFIEQHVVPNGLFFLDDASLASLRVRLTAEGIRGQIGRNEELIAVPGPAADQLVQALLKDPLRLREFMLSAIDPRALGAGDDAITQDNASPFSVDGRSLLIRIGGAKPVSDLDFTKSFLAVMQSAADRANTNGLRLEFTGSYAIAATSEKSIRADMISSVFSAVVLMQALFLLMYRRLASFALAFAPTAVAILGAFGLFALLSFQLTPATAVVGAVLAGMGDDFSLHFMSHYDHRRERGDSPPQAALNTSRELIAPMLGALLTSLVGFIAIMQSSVPALRDFAWVSALGLAGAMIAAVTMLPALLVTLEPRFGRHWMKPGPRVRLGGIIKAIDRRRRPLILMIIVVWVAAGAMMFWRGGPAVPFANDLRVMHPQPNPALDLQERLPHQFGGTASIMLIHLRGDSPEGMLQTAHRMKDALTDPAVRAAGVTGVLSVATLLPDPAIIEARRSVISEIDATRVLADFDVALADSAFDPAAFAPFREFLTGFLRPSSPPTMDDLLTVRDLASSILPRAAVQSSQPPTESLAVILLDHPIRDRQDRDQIIDTIRGAMDGLPGVTLTGLTVLGHDTQQSIGRELGTLVGVAALAVVGLIVVFYRHPRDVALVLLPLAFGITCVLAYMHMSGDGLNPINLVGVPLLIGAGEDYGLYVLSLARQARANNETVDQLRVRLAASIHALTGTWLTTLIGFGSLMFTSTPAIQSLGRMTAVGMIACFAATVLGLVPIVLTLHRRHLLKAA